MAQNSLSILLQTNPAAVDTLAEKWGAVVENYQKATISGMYKHRELSGDPTAGVMQAKRFANATAKAYGTARSNGKADKIEALPVVIPMNDDKEWLTEVEEKDLIMYGVEGLITRRTQSQQKAVDRYFEREFFSAGASAGEVFTITGSTIDAKLESIIQKLETVGNDFVDGIDRSDMVLVLDTATYGLARAFIDTVPQANIDSSVGEFGMFHGVKTYSSVYLPKSVNYFIMRDEAIAQPIRMSIYNPAKVEFSDATAFGAFTYAGTKAVNTDLLFFAGTLGEVTGTSVAGAGDQYDTIITVTSALNSSFNNVWYKASTSTVTASAYGADATTEGYTKMVLVGGKQTLGAAANTHIMLVETDANDRIIKSSADIAIVKKA